MSRPIIFARSGWTRRVPAAVAALCLALALAGCFAPGAPGPDPVTLGHAKWCEQNPPSGYCVVAEPH